MMPIVENKTTPCIFPVFAGQPPAIIDLGAIARAAGTADVNPFIDAEWMNHFIATLHRDMNAAYSLGGYLEDRAALWRGTYLDDHNAVHLGIDVNAPAGTAVAVLHPCRVLLHVHDDEQNGGWGGVVIFKLEEPAGSITHFLYAHLARGGVVVKAGDRLKAGDIAGYLGRPQENGGWYEHLHVQAMTADAWTKTQGDLSKFDGYAAMPDNSNHPLFPDPMPLVMPDKE